jgi:2-aminobenzoate-CoA ligase
VPGFRARVLGPDGRKRRAARPGASPCKGRPAAATSPTRGKADYVQDGWNITGDTYVQDADGYFWYQARSDDMIVSAGYNIAGPEVERRC